MKILIACESSGTVREAFRKLGHDAWSNDILPSDDDSPYHIEGDCVDAIKSRKWDMIGMHLPCTALAVSGNAHYGKGMPKNHIRLKSIEWTMYVWNLATSVCDRVYLENPVGVLPMKATQYIQPWMFGEDASKKTCLWLKGLPPLMATTVIKKKRYANQTPSGQNKLAPSTDRWKIRSKTYQGIADAMAQQWG